MNKMLKIIKREFLTKVFTRGFLIATILGPVFIIAIILAPAYFLNVAGKKPITIGVVDYSQIMQERLAETFPDTLKSGVPHLNFAPLSTEDYSYNPDKYKAQVDNGALNAILIIPDNVLDSATVTYIGKTVSDLDLMQSLKRGMTGIINNERLRRAGLDPDRVKELTRSIRINSMKIEKGETRARGFDEEYISAMIFLFILYITIIVYGSSIMRSVIEEKTSRIVEVLLSSTNSFQLMMGKLLGVGAVGLVQYIIWAAMAGAVILAATSSVPAMAEAVQFSPTILLYFILFFIIGYFTFSTLYTAVGAMCSDMQDAQTLSTPVTLFIVLPFMISLTVIRDPTTDLAQILSFLPFFTPLIMFVRILIVKPPIWEIVSSVLINILTILLITWLAARIYRVGILMYGKRPTVPEMIKWIRYK
jgi:ABC-2 type transport system permease protein